MERTELQKMIDDRLDWGIEQNSRELSTFLSMILPIDSVLEIGTGARGGLTRIFALFGCRVTTIDIQAFETQTRIPGVEYIVLGSPDEQHSFGRAFDLVFIDGDHSYEAVKRDFNWYGRLSKIIAFHDIVEGRGETTEGAARFWREIAYDASGSLRDNCYEAIEDGPDRVGIGWICR